MALFGEKCARCGDSTRHKVEEKAICESCEAEMALILTAESEAQRVCPVDGEWMVKEIVHMLVIDRCEKCHGVWLDGGELERLKGGVESDALRAVATGFTVPFS